jgi:hypothetical protein
MALSKTIKSKRINTVTIISPRNAVKECDVKPNSAIPTFVSNPDQAVLSQNSYAV